MSAWLITRLCNHSNCVSQRVSGINMNEVLHWNSSLPSKKKYCQKHVHFLSMETEISNYSYAALLNGWFCDIGEMCFQILAYEIQVSQKENNKNGRRSKCCNILLEADYVVVMDSCGVSRQPPGKKWNKKSFRLLNEYNHSARDVCLFTAKLLVISKEFKASIKTTF